MINKRIIYFIIAIVLFLQFNKVENMDVDTMIRDQQEKIEQKMGDKMPDVAKVDMPSVNNLVNAAINGEELNTSIDQIIKDSIANASSKKNVYNISTDGEEINNKVINNDPTVEVSQPETNEEEEGGGMNVTLILFIIISVLIIVKK